MAIHHLSNGANVLIDTHTSTRTRTQKHAHARTHEHEHALKHAHAYAHTHAYTTQKHAHAPQIIMFAKSYARVLRKYYEPPTKAARRGVRVCG